MPCYLCAYQLPNRPERERALPPGGIVSASYVSLGVCVRCGVHACSEHASRPSEFECAICRPATTTLAGFGVDGDSPQALAAFETSRRIGEYASGEQLERVARVVDQVLEAAEASTRPFAEPAGFGAEAPDERPNLIADLAAVIGSRMRDERRRREFTGEEAFKGDHAFAAEQGLVPEVQTGDPAAQVAGALSIDAIGAAAAASFAGHDLRRRPEATAAVAGALLTAMATANEQTRSIELGDGHEQVSEVEVVPPWEVSHPILLDPVIWMVATAYTE